MSVFLWAFWLAVGAGVLMKFDVSLRRLAFRMSVVLEHIDPN